ncbi:hypothetical protein DF160_20700 [Burkholderia anthina]|nr:hypothetical protein DF160_20700 [Burkholderia anthina]
MGGALNDARRRGSTIAAREHRRIVPCGRIHAPGGRVAARPAPCSRPSHGPGAHGPRITWLASRGRADVTAYLLGIK